jgi:hypothetical protein
MMRRVWCCAVLCIVYCALHYSTVAVAVHCSVQIQVDRGTLVLLYRRALQHTARATRYCTIIQYSAV